VLDSTDTGDVQREQTAIPVIEHYAVVAGVDAHCNKESVKNDS
jgi:hypothetical protein